MLFISILLVNYLIQVSLAIVCSIYLRCGADCYQDGESHWLEGVLLISIYTIIALASWFYPNGSDTGAG